MCEFCSVSPFSAKSEQYDVVNECATKKEQYICLHNGSQKTFITKIRTLGTVVQTYVSGAARSAAQISFCSKVCRHYKTVYYNFLQSTSTISLDICMNYWRATRLQEIKFTFQEKICWEELEDPTSRRNGFRAVGRRRRQKCPPPQILA